MQNQVERLLRLPEVRNRTGLSRSTIYERVARGEFPAPLSLGARAVAWRESEIAAWISARIAARAEPVRRQAVA